MKKWMWGIIAGCVGVMFVIGIRLGGKNTASLNIKERLAKEVSIPQERLEAGSEVKQEEKKVLSAKDWIDLREIEVAPGVTLAEVEEKLRQAKEIDPSEVEVTPPENGKRGLTLAEVEENLREAEEAERNMNPAEVEVVPPERPGERGVTLAEIEENLKLEKQREETGPENIVITSPEDGGERVTLAEVEKNLREAKKQEDLKEIEVAPGLSAAAVEKALKNSKVK